MNQRIRTNRSAHRFVRYVMVLFSGFVSLACGSVGTSYPTAATSAAIATSVPSAPSVPSSKPPSPPTLVGGSTDAVMVPSTGCCAAGPTVLLTKVTTQHLDGFDRIVFEFTSAVVSYHVRYVPLPVKQDPSDQVVDLKGDNAIQISMGATGLNQSVTPAQQTYGGPLRIAVGEGGVIELVQNGDFEAVSNWALGVRGKPAFRVSTGSGPSTLVIDVASPLPPTR